MSGPTEITLDDNSFIVQTEFSISPDLLVTTFAFTDTSFTRNSEIGFKVGVFNQGGEYVANGNPPIVVDIIVTQDTIIGNDDDITLGLGSQGQIQHVGDLGSDEAFLDTKTYLVPDIDPGGANADFPAGTYFPVALVDAVNEVGEIASTQGNNRFFLDPLDLFADLVVSAANVPVASYMRGANVDIDSVTVQNTAEFDLEETTFIEVFISKNKVRGDLDDIVLFESLEVANILIAREAEVITDFSSVSTTVPDNTAAGDYFVGIQVDFDNLITEADDSNNIFFTANADINIAEADLADSLEEHLPDPPGGNPSPFEEKQNFEVRLGGDSSWFGQTAMVTGNVPGPVDSTEAGQSGEIDDNGETFFEFDVNFVDDFEISFYWKVDSEPGFDFLSFSINGEEIESISGLGGDFVEVREELSPGPYTFRFTYRKDGTVSQGEDAGWVDSVTFFQLAVPPLPDLIVEDIFFEPGTFVLQLDDLELTVLGSNQGSAADIQGLPDDFSVKVYLSVNSSFDVADDPLVGELLMLRDLDENASFIFEGVVDLPTTLASGDYHVVVEVDATDIVVEFDEGNNIFISELPDVTIEARPDLKVTELNHDPGFFLFGDTLTLDFAVTNDGLERAVDPFKVTVVLSDDRVFGSTTDFELTSVVFTGGVSVGQTQSFVSTIQIPEGTPIGRFLFIGVVVDFDEEIPESNEDNNALGSDDEDLFFAAVSLEEGLDLDEAEGGASAFQIINNLSSPFFGQLDDTFDTIDAVQSRRVGNNTTASFEILVIPQTRTVVSFRWRVSSERTETEMGLKEDFLAFFIDGTEVNRISGEIDWFDRSFVLEAGEHTIKWAYTKDDTIGEGKDAGFVDRLKLIVPDLVITNLAVPIGTFSPGQLISPITFDIENEGIADVPATPYTVDLVLSQDDTVDGSDFLVDTFDRNDGLESGGVINISRDITVPANVAFAGNYFLIVTVDVGDVIPEADEGNNTALSGATDIDISLAITLNLALDLDVDPDAALLNNLSTSGDGVWFPQGDHVLADGSSSTNDGVDAAEAPSLGFNESSFLEIEVTGPAVLSFFWKVSSEPALNFLSLELNGVEDRRISGEAPFTAEALFIPNGFNVVRWVWTKLSSVDTGEDTGWVDQIDVDPVTVPELVITRLDVTEGEYVLGIGAITGQQGVLLGTEFLDITIEAENQGDDFAAGAFTLADIEVRLSLDNTYGNDDDIILGDFAQVENTFDGGHKVRFLGPIHLGDDIPEDDYFVLAKIDPLGNVVEFDENNNIAAILGPDVQITRLPDLDFAAPIVFDEQRIYFPTEALKFDITILNTGLDIVEGDVEWSVRVDLRALSKETIQGYVDTFTDPATAGELPDSDTVLSNSLGPFELGVFSQQQLMFGRSEAQPFGDSIDTTVFLFLPNNLQLDFLIGEDEPVEDFLYWIELNLDVDDTVREIGEGEFNQFRLFAGSISNLVSGSVPPGDPTLVVNDRLFQILNSVPDQGPAGLDSDDWAQLYFTSASAGQNDDTDLVNNLLEYALNRNPFVDDTSTGKLTEVGTITVDDMEYLRLAFDIVKGANDLTYDVDGADDVGFTTNVSDLITITPPYTGFGVGPTSLSGDGGLTSDPVVVQAVDNGFSARVTVRDDVAIGNVPSRFMRITIVDTDGTGPVFTTFPVKNADENVLYTYNIVAIDPGDTINLTDPFGTVPPWLVFTPAGNLGTGVLTGTPIAGNIAVTNEFDISIRATDSEAKTRDQDFTITVEPAAP